MDYGHGIVADDLNGDGHSDVAVSSNYHPFASVAYGNGNGSLGSFSTIGTGMLSRTFAIAAGQLVGSLHPELVVTDASGFKFLANNGAGSFSPSSYIYTGGASEQPVIADMNGDSFNDVVVGRLEGGVSVTYMNGTGGVIQTTLLSGVGVIGVTVGDFNGDGRKDIAAAGFTGNSVHVYLNQGPTQFPGFVILALILLEVPRLASFRRI